MKFFSALRHPVSTIVLPPLIAVLYLWLGWHVFLLMLECAFAGDLARWALVLVIAGAAGGFVLSFLPSIVWPRSRFVWAFFYSAVSLVFGFATIGDIDSSKGLWSFLVWSGCGVTSLLCGWQGGAYGKRVASRLAR